VFSKIGSFEDGAFEDFISLAEVIWEMLTLKDAEEGFADDLEATPFNDVGSKERLVYRCRRKHIRFMS
jgi:uncharacterized protein YjaG (DUF416 family)